MSGGSFTNGFFAQAGEYRGASGAEAWTWAKPLARTIARKTLWAGPVTWLYLAWLSLSLAAIVALAFWVVPVPGWARILLFLVLLLPWGWSLQLRGLVGGRAYGRNLFSPEGTPTALADTATGLDHVFCATHLNAGEHFYFSPRFVYSYRFGWGGPGRLPLHAVVQASSAFPGGFPPRWMRTGRFEFRGAREAPSHMPRFVTLADGAVYDNLGEQWPRDVERHATDGGAPDGLRIPDTMVIVNASTGLRWSDVRALHIPFYGEFLALKRDVGVMSNNSVSLRMEELYREFTGEGGFDGALVSIVHTPFHIPRRFASGEGPARDRAEVVLGRLGDTEGEWRRIAEANGLVHTTLSRVGPDVAARLIHHGYVVAMANLHTVLGFPLLDLPGHARFRSLVD